MLRPCNCAWAFLYIFFSRDTTDRDATTRYIVERINAAPNKDFFIATVIEARKEAYQLRNLTVY